MIVVGVDPGLDGAYAVYDGEGLILVPVPAVKAKGRGRTVLWQELISDFELFCGNADHAFFEQVNARPDDGGSSAFKFGRITGNMEMIVRVNLIPLTYVTPAKWKMSMGVTASKDVCVSRAGELFPRHAHLFRGPRGGLKDGPAEAALIAWYGHRQLTKEK